MKTIQFLSILLLAIFFSNCSNDDDNTTLTETDYFPSQISFDGDIIRYIYNDDNQIVSINIDNGNFIANLTYNEMGNLIEWDETTGTENIVFSYDANNHLNQMTVTGSGDLNGTHTIDRNSNNDYEINFEIFQFIMNLNESDEIMSLRYDINNGGNVTTYQFAYNTVARGVFDNIAVQPALLILTNLLTPSFEHYFFSQNNISDINSGLPTTLIPTTTNDANFPTTINVTFPSEDVTPMSITYIKH